MQTYSLIAIVAAAACVFLLWLLQFRIRATLKDRHPETYQTVENHVLGPSWGLTMFMWSNGDKWLGDPAVSRDILRLKMLVPVGAIAVFIAAYAFGGPNA